MGDLDLSIGPPPAGAAGDDGEPDVYRDDPGPGQWDEPAELAPEVPEPVVRGLVATLGTVLASSPVADEDVPEHWQFTDRELDALAPPLTRMVNARPQLRAAVAHGDELIVAVQIAGYLGRNVNDATQARRRRIEQEEEHHGYVEPEAGGPAAAGDRAPRGAAGGEPEAWAPPAAGVGVHPPTD